MLGETYGHLDIDARFLEWVNNDKMLQQSSVIIEWVERNPFAHDDPRYAPVGNYMFSAVDKWLERVA